MMTAEEIAKEGVELVILMFILLTNIEMIGTRRI